MMSVLRRMIPIFLVLSLLLSCSHDYDSDTLDLAFYQWNLWPDLDAEWENDSLYVPPVDISELPYNPPTCGWEVLHRGNGKLVRIPATVEEHFSGEESQITEQFEEYTGVSWFHTRFTLPDLWNRRRILLKFEGISYRAEVYLNETLVGYHVGAGIPFTIDLTGIIYYTRDNHIAIRITDPAGDSGLGDQEKDKWGIRDIQRGQGYGGVTGNISLLAKDNLQDH